MKVLILSADQFDDAELKSVLASIKKLGGEAEVASLQKGPLKGVKGAKVDALYALSEVRGEHYSALVIPGATAGILRHQPGALEIARHFFTERKLVGAIGRGVEPLISANLLRGRFVCSSGADEELKDAGARVQKKDFVVDQFLVTSRDVKSFLGAFAGLLR